MYARFLSENVRPELSRLKQELQKLNKRYMKAQMEFENIKSSILMPIPPSGLPFGSVKGYYSKDAVYFKPVSTLKGIIEKDNPEIYDYNVPDKAEGIICKPRLRAL